MAEELSLVPEEFRDKLLPLTAGKPRTRCHIHAELDREVFVTFYTHFDTKIVHMFLKQYHALNQITEMATDIFPPGKWRVFAGGPTNREHEFLSDSQVWDAIGQGMSYDFEYLRVHLDRA